jgi:SecD/SecF fusion protein
MKTILYILIAVMISGLIATGFINTPQSKSVITLKAVENFISRDQLTQSVNIMSARLQDFSSEKFDISIEEPGNLIKVTLNNEWDIRSAIELLTNRGRLGFYETLTNNPSDKIDLASLDKEKGTLLTNRDIESVKYEKSESYLEIKIELKEASVSLWTDATRRNMDKAIAIVLDDSLLAAPVVRSVITGGHLAITGDFSETVARYITSIANNDELPVQFNVVK